MRPRLAAVLLVLGAIGLFCWRAELFTVSKPGDAARPLARTGAGLAGDAAAPAPFDVSLPMVPIGVARLTPGGQPLLVHYWAPWERHGRAQVLALDSLVRTLPTDHVRIAVVCFDPFPSVARFVGRLRVRVPVMLDLKRDMQAALPCPSLPYTWLLDASGHVVVSQPGEVDWLAPATRALLLHPERAAPGDTLIVSRFPRRVRRGRSGRPAWGSSARAARAHRTAPR